MAENEERVDISVSPGDDELINKIWSDEDEGGNEPPVEETTPPADGDGEPPPVEENTSPSDDNSPPADLMGGDEPPSEEPPPPPPVEEPAEEEPPEGLDPKAKESFIHLRTERRELKKKVAQLEEALKAKEVNPETDAKMAETVAGLEAKLREAEERLGQLSLAETAAFKQRYDVPLTAAYNRAVKLITKAGIAPNEAKAMASKALSMNTQQRLQLFAEEVPSLQGALINIYEDISELRDSRVSALNNWKQSRAAVESEAKRVDKVNLVRELQANVEKSVKFLQDEGDFMLKKSASNDKWNQGVDARIELAKGILASAKPEDLARYVLAGVSAVQLRGMYSDVYSKYNKLVADSKKLVTKVVGPRGGATSPVTETKPDKDMSDDDLHKQIWGG